MFRSPLYHREAVIVRHVNPQFETLVWGEVCYDKPGQIGSFFPPCRMSFPSIGIEGATIVVEFRAEAQGGLGVVGFVASV